MIFLAFWVVTVMLLLFAHGQNKAVEAKTEANYYSGGKNGLELFAGCIGGIVVIGLAIALLFAAVIDLNTNGEAYGDAYSAAVTRFFQELDAAK